MQMLSNLLCLNFESRIKVSCVIKRVVELFKGNEDLILEFNLFLPQGSKITSDGSIIQH